MTTRVELNDATTMPWLAFGSGTKLRDKDASKHVTHAIKAGFRHIDAAQMYGNEESVGRGIAASGVPREELYITTKLDKLSDGVTVIDSLKDSLAKLQTEYVDMFLVHVPIHHENLEEVWKGMELCKVRGLARSIGVSNFQLKHLKKILSGAVFRPAVNQIEMHPYVLYASQPLLDYMQQNHILTTGFGGLTPVARFPDGPVDSVLSRIADRLTKESGVRVTPAQVLHLWLRKKGVPYVSTTTDVARMKEYLGTEKLPDISDEEQAEIDAAGSEVHHRLVCTWIDEQEDEADAAPPGKLSFNISS